MQIMELTFTHNKKLIAPYSRVAFRLLKRILDVVKAVSLVFITVLYGATVLSAQALERSDSTQSTHISIVRIDDRSASLQVSLYPDFYKTHSVSDDIDWVTQHSGDLTVFWAEQGTRILQNLSELSGIEWAERGFTMYLVKYFPSVGCSDPLIVPLGGIMTGSLIEAAPTGNSLLFDAVFLLAQRMLAQATPEHDARHAAIAGHPLAEPGPLRRDNMAMLLTISVCSEILGRETTMNVFQSAFWRTHAPGHQILTEHLLDKWVLTPEHTLADYLADESSESPLVLLTRQPERTETARSVQLAIPVSGVPLKGKLGIAVRAASNDGFEVETLDTNRLAYACGLRAGDRIRAVDGVRPRTHRELVERILESLADGVAVIQVSRQNTTQSIALRPMRLPTSESRNSQADSTAKKVEASGDATIR
ncbi:MAG TPA: hypothetical protein VN285_10500 [Candidatus Deferrimicrobium sp.]|nr:hypothetical protein [Candidatus Deferrimicrobium sp.]